jgi:hypothetical protein
MSGNDRVMVGDHFSPFASPGLRGDHSRIVARAVALIGLLIAAAASADGGQMCVTQSAGPFEVTVFTAPAPARVGPVDVSVLVVDRAGHVPLLDADVQVGLRGTSPPALALGATATHAGAVNKLLYAVALDVPTAGRWALDARVRAGEREATVSCDLDVEPPLGPLTGYWPYLALPAVAIGLFALQQWIRRSRSPA